MISTTALTSSMLSLAEQSGCGDFYDNVAKLLQWGTRDQHIDPLVICSLAYTPNEARFQLMLSTQYRNMQGNWWSQLRISASRECTEIEEYFSAVSSSVLGSENLRIGTALQISFSVNWLCMLSIQYVVPEALPILLSVPLWTMLNGSPPFASHTAWLTYLKSMHLLHLSILPRFRAGH